MVTYPFFCLKIGRLKATVCKVTHPSMKNWFSRFDGFCYHSASSSPTVAYWAKSLGTSRCDGWDMPMVAQPLHELPSTRHLVFTRTVTSLWPIFCNSGSARNGCATIRLSQTSQRDMPMNKKPSRSKIR
jgi:hypothetical protein